MKSQKRADELVGLEITNHRNSAKLAAALGDAAGVKLEAVPDPSAEAEEVDGDK